MYRVLVVEDEDIIRKGIMLSFDWTSIQCTMVGEARNGLEGVEKIQELSPDIVILDVNMPLMDGLEMIKSTIEKYEYSAIILSGYSEFDYAKRAMKYGATEYLLKPLNKEEMLEAVERAKKEREIKKAYLIKQNDREQLKSIELLKEYDSSSREDAVVKKMVAYIEKNYERKITMQDLVEALNYSETFLNRRFKGVMGTTFIDYLNRYRIQRSIGMIMDKNLTIQEIAWACGVGEYKYFRTVFKKYVGCSPKEYMRSIS